MPDDQLRQPTAGAHASRLQPAAAARRVGYAVPIEAWVFVAALVPRLGAVLRHRGGLTGSAGYDSGVYFAASDAFLHGRLPYRDFVLLHPPGLMLALTPLAVLTRVLTDRTVFAVSSLAFCVLGAVNAVLVVRVCRRLGLSLRGAAVGGLFYALWGGAIGAEYHIKLEPLGNLLLLVGLLTVLRNEQRGGGSFRAALAFVPLGLLVTVKIWWVVPVAAVLIWYALRTRDLRRVAAAVAGTVVAALAVDLPFFLVDPHAMWSSVISEQLGRNPIAVSPLIRAGDLSSLPRLVTTLSTRSLAVVTLGVAVVAVILVRRAWQVPVARAAVLLLLVQTVVLFAAPSWFAFYCDYLAVAASLTVGAAATPVGTRMRNRSVTPGAAVAGVAALLSVVTLISGASSVHPFGGAAQLSRAVAGVRCVMSDSPTGQIELNALSRGLANGCRNWVDVTGRTYGPDKGTGRRTQNRRWQRDLKAYLRSGGAVIIVRRGGTGLNKSTFAAVSRDGVLARVGGHKVFRVVGG